MTDLDQHLTTAQLCVRAAVRASLAHFHDQVKVEIKPDRTPVTQADKDAEAAILALLAERHPHEAVLSEESGAHGSGQARWIVDPLDGTRGFSRGGSFWGPLVAFEDGGEIVVGAMALPVLGEMYFAARGQGTFRQMIDHQGRNLGARTRVRVSGISDWSEATLSLGELKRFMAGDKREAVARLGASAAQARCFGDLAACAMLFCGRAEAWIESGVKTWDLAALKILVEEAGGRFTDWQGGASIEEGLERSRATVCFTIVCSLN